MRLKAYTFGGNVIDMLLENAERLWTLDEILHTIEPSGQTEELI
jgi:hypothetical protein